MEDMVKKATARLQALKAEMATLEAFLDSARQVAGLLGGDPQITVEAVAQKREPGRRGPKGVQMGLVFTAAKTAILKAGHPLRSRELVQPLLDAGVHVGGSNPSGSAAARVGQTKRFVSTKVGYWPKGIALPAKFRSVA